MHGQCAKSCISHRFLRHVAAKSRRLSRTREIKTLALHFKRLARKEIYRYLQASYLKVKYAQLSARNCRQTCSEHAGTQRDRYKSVVSVCNLFISTWLARSQSTFSPAIEQRPVHVSSASICSNRR